MKRIDLTGHRFGRLMVESYSDTRHGRAYWNCRCDCGNSTQVCSLSLTSGNTTSCGCKRAESAISNIKGATRPPIPIIGNRFGRLIVLSMIDHSPNEKIRYLCRCDCGRELTVLGDSLRSGNTRSCGCLAHEVRVQTGKNSKGLPSGKVPDLIGQRFTRLLVKERVPSRNGQACWRCVCDCGKETITTTAKLRNGHAKSCGCLGLEHATRAKIKHGMTKTPLYAVFQSMHARCENPNLKGYKWYGAKGVSVCHEWAEFAPFKEWAMNNGYKEGLTIDRVNPNGNYEPSNCRWITRSENSCRVIHKKKE